MQPFQKYSSNLIPLKREHVDTDQIIPARYLKVVDKAGLTEGLFAAWRYQADGSPDPAFPLNQPAYQGSQILLAGDNFGCGSSREHAPWALRGWGIHAVISTSFADIFYSNALKNNLLPIVVNGMEHQELFYLAEQDPLAQVTLDLDGQSLILPDGSRISFSIDPFNKYCLLEGVDQLGYILKFAPQIEAYEQSHPRFA